MKNRNNPKEIIIYKSTSMSDIKRSYIFFYVSKYRKRFIVCLDIDESLGNKRW